MVLIHGFIFSEQFCDDMHFPQGFKNSGEFSIFEAELLNNVGSRLFLLEHDLCEPKNQVEEQFVQMCKSQLEGQTKVELLWQKYKTLTKNKAFHSFN